MKILSAILIVSFTLICKANAQSIGPSIINSAGGTAVIGTNEFDWSIGEMTLISTARVLDTYTNDSFYLTQGLLQPAGFTNEGVHNNSPLANQLQIFPNPASTVVNIAYTTPVADVLTYRLMDMKGEVITTNSMDAQIGKNASQLNIANLADATYMLEVIVNEGSASEANVSYKIEKRN